MIHLPPTGRCRKSPKGTIESDQEDLLLPLLTQTTSIYITLHLEAVYGDPPATTASAIISVRVNQTCQLRLYGHVEIRGDLWSSLHSLPGEVPVQTVVSAPEVEFWTPSFWAGRNKSGVSSHSRLC